MGGCKTIYSVITIKISVPNDFFVLLDMEVNSIDTHRLLSMLERESQFHRLEEFLKNHIDQRWRLQRELSREHLVSAACLLPSHAKTEAVT